MTPKEKAKELIYKFAFLKTDNEATPPKKKKWYFVPTPLLKQCALICVDEIIAQWDYIDTYLADMKGDLNPNLKYWQEVKQEIEKL